MTSLDRKQPWTCIPQNLSAAEYFLGEAAQYGNKVAFIDAVTGHSITYRQLIIDVRRVASGLQRAGIKKNDVICVYCRNCMEYPTILFASMSIGSIVTTCNPLYTVDEFTDQLQDSGASYVITQTEFLDKAKSGAKRCGQIKQIYCIGDGEGSIPFSRLLEDDGACYTPASVKSQEDVALIPYSSGTTGKNKGVLLTHYNLIAHSCNLWQDDVQMFSSDDVTVAFLPFFHMFAIGIHLTYPLTIGVTTVVMPQFSLEGFLRAVETYKATVLLLVPPVVIMITNSPQIDKFNLSSLKFAISAAAPLGKEQTEAFMAKTGCPVRQGYGMTEVTAAVIVSPREGWKHGSVGYALPNTEVKVIDVDTGRTLGPHEDGELLIRGPVVMKGYLNRPEVTSQTINHQGWLHSGDICHFDEDGHFYIVDRVKELIKYKGYQVAPAELESLILAHPGVADVAVIGIHDNLAGELPRAYVVKKVPGLTEKDVIRYVEGHVSPHKRLRGGVRFVDTIPKSPSGKILRRFIRQKANSESKL